MLFLLCAFFLSSSSGALPPLLYILCFCHEYHCYEHHYYGHHHTSGCVNSMNIMKSTFSTGITTYAPNTIRTFISSPPIVPPSMLTSESATMKNRGAAMSIPV